jgi:hypothetical protein
MFREALTASGVPVLTIFAVIEADAAAYIRRVVEEFTT